MLEEAQPELETALDIRSRAVDVHQQAIRVPGDQKQMVGSGERNDGLVVLGRWAELSGELFRREEFAVIWTGWVVKILEKIGKRIAITQRKADRQVDAGFGIDFCDWLKVFRRKGDVIAEGSEFGSTNRPNHKKKSGSKIAAGFK